MASAVTSHTMPAVAADNGCDDEDNDMIVAELALCSTHVYNIGQPENPSNDTERGYMKDMVALKSTIMTQQLNKQYEYLESMIRRFKTQLEKAVLTTKLQTAGAAVDSGAGSSYRSDDKNNHLAGVRNCLNVYQDAEKLKCYEDNLNVIINTSNHGNNVDADLKKQLAFDYEYLAEITFSGGQKCDFDKKKCGNTKMSKSDFQSCLNGMRSCLSNQYRAYNNQQAMLQKK